MSDKLLYFVSATRGILCGLMFWWALAEKKWRYLAAISALVILEVVR